MSHLNAVIRLNLEQVVVKLLRVLNVKRGFLYSGYSIERLIERHLEHLEMV